MEKKSDAILDLGDGKEMNLSELVSAEMKAMLEDSGLEIKDGKLHISELPTEVRAEVEGKMKGAEVSANFIKSHVIPEKEHAKYGVKAVTSETTSMGYAVPTELATKILEKKDEVAKIRNRAFVYQMAGKFELPVENVSVTGYWVGENTEITESAPTLAKKSFEDNYVAARVIMPWKLMNGTSLSIENYVASLMARQLVAAEESKFVAGDGDGEPLGIRDAASSISSIAQAGTGLMISDLKSLYYALPEQYRAGATFLTSGAGKEATENLKDTANRPLFPVEKTLDVLFGKAFEESQHIPENLGVGTDTTEVYFGDFSFYHIKEGTTLSMASDQIIAKLQTELVMYQAVDGGVVLSDAFRKLTGVKAASAS